MPGILASPFQLPKRRQLKTTPNTIIEIENKLLHVNEPLNVQIRCLQATRPPDRLTIFNHYLKHVYKSQTEIALTWKKSDDRWETQFSFQPDGVGSYLIRFSNGVRDKINPYTRYFSVVDEKTTICLLNHLLDSPMANYHNLYHRYFIPADYEILFNQIYGKIEANPAWVGHHIYRYYASKYGDTIFPRVNLQTAEIFQPDLTPSTVSIEPEKYPALINRIVEAWQKEFLYPKTEILGLESPSEAAVRATFSTPLKAITGLIPDRCSSVQTKLGTKGLPLFPFFINQENCCAAAEGQSPLVGFSVTSHPLLSHEFAAYQLSPAIAEYFHYADSGDMQSLYDFIDEFLNNRDARTPHFLSVDIKAHYIPEVVKMNVRMIRRLLRLARKEKIVFAQKVEAAKYFQRHFQKTPERAFYLTDMYKHHTALPGGSAWLVRQKPPHAHDMIYFENNECRVCFRQAEMKPFYYYAYSGPAKATGSNLSEPDLSQISIKCVRTFEPAYKFVLEITSQQNLQQFPLAFWNLPFIFEDVKNKLQHNFNRFIPVLDLKSNTFNSIAMVNLTAGTNSFYLDFGSKLKRVY